MAPSPEQRLRFAGVLLAGGKSSRMGRNKAEIVVNGEPLWLRGYKLLADVGAVDRWISVGTESTWLPADVANVRDRSKDCGPIGGIAAAMEVLAAQRRILPPPAPALVTHVIVLAVDLPRMEAPWIEQLKGQCALGRGAIGRWADGGAFEPLAAVYPVEMARIVGEAMAAKEYSLQRLAARGVAEGLLRVRPIAEADTVRFANWNSPEDIGK